MGSQPFVVEELENVESSSGSAAAEEQHSAEQPKGEEVPKGTEQPVGKAQTSIDPDTQEVIDILTQAGVTKQNINVVLGSAQTLSQFNYLLENDPKQLVRRLEANNPRVGKQLLETISDLYIERYYQPDEESDGKSGGTKSRGAVSESPEMAAMREDLNNIKMALAGQSRNAAYQELRKNYNAKLDESISKLTDLSAKDRKAIKALANQSLAEDPKAMERIQAGFFVDIPRHVKSVVDDWTADNSKATEDEKAEREKQKAGSGKQITEAARPTGEREAGKEGSGDIWEDAAQGMAKELQKAAAASRKTR